MSEKGHVIILDGCSSSGKTSTALALQKILEPPYLYVSLDEMMRTLPAQLIELVSASSLSNHDVRGIRFIQQKDEEGKPSISVHLGPYGEKMIYGFINTIKGLVEAGNNVICDTIITDLKWYDLLKKTLQGFSITFIGLYAPLEVLELREINRREPLGLARGRFKAVYQETKKYDLFIDTSQVSIKEAAEQIKTFIIAKPA